MAPKLVICAINGHTSWWRDQRLQWHATIRGIAEEDSGKCGLPESNLGVLAGVLEEVTGLDYHEL